MVISRGAFKNLGLLGRVSLVISFVLMALGLFLISADTNKSTEFEIGGILFFSGALLSSAVLGYVIVRPFWDIATDLYKYIRSKITNKSK